MKPHQGILQRKMKSPNRLCFTSAERQFAEEEKKLRRTSLRLTLIGNRRRMVFEGSKAEKTELRQSLQMDIGYLKKASESKKAQENKVRKGEAENLNKAALRAIKTVEEQDNQRKMRSRKCLEENQKLHMNKLESKAKGKQEEARLEREMLKTDFFKRNFYNY